MNVARHPIRRDMTKDLAGRDGHVARVAEAARKDGRNLVTLAGCAESHALFLARTVRPTVALVRALGTAAQAAAAALTLAENKGSRVQLRIGDADVTLDGFSPDSTSNPGRWLGGFFHAAIARDDDSLRALAAIRDATLRACLSNGVQCDEYQFAFVGALRALWRGKKETLADLRATLAASAPDRIDIADPVFVAQRHRPLIRLALRLVEGDAKAFNAALEEALVLHRDYWSSTEERREDPDGFLALGPLALACLAHDRGVAVEVDSDYAPTWIIRRQWA